MKKIFLILFIYLLQFNFVSANTTITFINMDKIILTSKPGLSIIKQLKIVNFENNEKLNNEAKKLKNKEKKLISQKNILSEKDFQFNLNKLKLEIKDYNTNRDKINNNFKKLKVDNTNKLLKMINPILAKYSDEKSISLVLQKKNLIIGKSELDITDEIIKIINTDIDEFKIK